MAVDGVNGNSGSSSGSNTMTSTANKTLDKNAFLKLLVTQLQYQDPMNPMDDTQFISQLAQFSALEQMQEMNSGFSDLSSNSASTRALSLVDRWIDYADPDSGTTLTGKVDGVCYEDGKPKLVVGNATVNLNNVTRVYPDASSLGKSKLTTQAIGMIGKNVNYYDTTTGAVASGKVEGIGFVDGWPMLKIGEATVDARNVVGAQYSSGTSSNDLVDQANAMVGHTVGYTTADGGTASGKVTAIKINNGVPSVVVNGENVELSRVMVIA